MNRAARKRRRDGDGFNLSFLDAISCGFGAIVILLVLTKMGVPRALEQARIDLQARLAKLQEEIYEIRGETIYQRRGFVLDSIHLDAIVRSRAIKPAIPLVGFHGIPIRDEIELDKAL